MAVSKIRYEKDKLMGDEISLLHKLFPEDSELINRYSYTTGEGVDAEACIVQGGYQDFADNGDLKLDGSSCLNIRIACIWEDSGNIRSAVYSSVLQNGIIKSVEINEFDLTGATIGNHRPQSDSYKNEEVSPSLITSVLAEMISSLADKLGLEKPKRGVLERINSVSATDRDVNR